MTKITNEIASDIELLANYWIDIKDTPRNRIAELTAAAQRVEAWLATYRD